MEVVRDQQWIKSDDLFRDPAFIVPVILSCIAFVAILISVGICIKRSKLQNLPNILVEERNLEFCSDL